MPGETRDVAGLSGESASFRVMTFATKGAGTNEEDRVRGLLERFDPDVFPFDRRRKIAMFFALLRRFQTRRWDLVVMEGTGVAGGLAIVIGRWLARIPYVVSTGDAVTPFMAARSRWLAVPFAIYERMLYASSSGVIGWSPYLAGRALTLAAPRAITAAGWAPYVRTAEELAVARAHVRDRLGIPADALVVGIAGSLAWTRRYRYCYGGELVRAIGRVRRRDVRVLIVGDGSGRSYLERLAADAGERRVVFTGSVPQCEIPDYLAAMDVGSLPQSVDGVGSFRYTTKLSEYLAAALPVVTGQTPVAYDLDEGWLWRLPGSAPWDPRYVAALAAFIESLTPTAIDAKRVAVPRALAEFDRARQVARVTRFIMDILDVDRRSA